MKKKIFKYFACMITVAILATTLLLPSFLTTAPSSVAAPGSDGMRELDMAGMSRKDRGLVCASERGFPTSPCDEARKLAKRAEALRVPMLVQPEPLDHGEINRNLGLPSDYTQRVGDWIDRLTGVAGRR